MTSGKSPSFDLVDGALKQLGTGEGATDAHGSLCGLICILGTRARAVWISGLLDLNENEIAGNPAALAVMEDLAESSCAELSSGEMGFAPLLPPDEALLSVRVEALAAWCAGFMHGLGEASAGRTADAALNSDTSREIMADFAEITRLTLDAEEADLEAESAYTELVEFVRVSTQLLFDEFHELRQELVAASTH